MTFASLSNLSLKIPLTTNILLGIFFFLLIVFVIHMVVMRYHWNAYGNDRLRKLRMNIYYFIGSAILFIALTACLVVYSTSIATL